MTLKDKYYFMGKNKDYNTCSDNFKTLFGENVTRKGNYII